MGLNRKTRWRLEQKKRKTNLDPEKKISWTQGLCKQMNMSPINSKN